MKSTETEGDITRNHKKRFVPLIYRPKTPEGWYVQEQNDSPYSSYIAFVKPQMTHHNLKKPENIYVVFCEFQEGYQSYRYTVRGGRKAKPDETMKYFNDLKSATDYLIFIMESTDRWIEEINSKKYIQAYNDRIAKLVAEDEKRRAALDMNNQ
jgi:hypothetical protein